MNPNFNNGTWVDSVKMSMPEHVKYLDDALSLVMTEHGLTEIEAHGVALAAAIASGNGELAFEISVNGPLFGQDVREIATRAAVDTSINGVYGTYLAAANKSNINVPPSKKLTDPAAGQNYVMFCLSAAVVNKNEQLTSLCLEIFKDTGSLTSNQIQDVVNIASVVSSINKVVI